MKMKKVQGSHRGKMGGKMKIPRSATFKEGSKFPTNYTYHGTGVRGK